MRPGGPRRALCLCLSLSAFLLAAGAQQRAGPEHRELLAQLDSAPAEDSKDEPGSEPQAVDILETPEEALLGTPALKPVRAKSESLKPKVQLFIGLPSLHEHGDLRDAARKTWIPIARQSHVAVRFFCYIDTNHYGPDMLEWMQGEQKQHWDTVIVTPETLGDPEGKSLEHTWNTRMTIAMFRTATEIFDPQYVMRATDEAYVNIPVVMEMLAGHSAKARPFWYGYAHPGRIFWPSTDEESAEFKGMLGDTVHEPVVPQYMDGAGAILSVKVAQAVLAADDIVGLRILQNDAAAIGLWLGALDIYYMNETEAGCSVQPWEPLQEDRIEWDEQEKESMCLRSSMPLAVVHPCKTVESVQAVFRAAVACRDSLRHRRKRKP
ncbi:hypothetical protein CVIRNUC_009998 [Coccomyxa viridis]|uniref:Hexosyltransferase n=1 Tax=Coccomyxa viridis TaxID=1274662 RepID=A0AAV1ILG2_9CHLO|nr:hypothetical protein CVIRNUC_009998 [Coccomyxa viridis]